jgi:general secretion pathway protein A
MYLNHYGLDKAPFHITPDPDFLFPSPSHREALATLIYGARQRKGFIALTGEVGTGKTTLLRTFVKRVEGTHTHVLYFFSPALTFRELLKLIIRGLRIETNEKSTSQLLEAVHWGLIELYKQNRNLVIIIDEAHNMPVKTLEQLRMLSNLETSKEKLLQIVLAGQPELEHLLESKELRQLNQRIAVRARLKQLTHDEALTYIRHRIEVAGGVPDAVIAPAAANLIVRHAKGSPRTINILCDNALLAAFGAQMQRVEESIVREVIADLRGHTPAPRRWLWAAVATASLIAGILSAGALYLLQSGETVLGAHQSNTVYTQSAPDATAPVSKTQPETTPVRTGADARSVALEKMRAVARGLDAAFMQPAGATP